MKPLFVKTSGNDEGEPLIVLHGWGMNSAVWESVRPALESRYCVSWVDLPGHGKNKEVLVKKSTKSMDEIVNLIVPHIPEGAHLMGWSLGGLIIQAIAERLAGKSHIKSLTLVASTPKFSQADDWQYAMNLEVLDNFSQSLNQDIEATLKRFIALQFFGIKEMGVKDSKQLQHTLIDNVKKRGGVHPHALNMGLSLLKNCDYRIVSHNTPKHWVLAERDRLIPKEVINDLKLCYPDDQITLLENAGHAPFIMQPENVIACVTDFINNVR